MTINDIIDILFGFVLVGIVWFSVYYPIKKLFGKKKPKVKTKISGTRLTEGKEKSNVKIVTTPRPKVYPAPQKPKN